MTPNSSQVGILLSPRPSSSHSLLSPAGLLSSILTDSVRGNSHPTQSISGLEKTSYVCLSLREFPTRKTAHHPQEAYGRDHPPLPSGHHYTSNSVATAEMPDVSAHSPTATTLSFPSRLLSARLHLDHKL